MFDVLVKGMRAVVEGAAGATPGAEPKDARRDALRGKTHAEGQALLTPPEAAEAAAYNQGNFQSPAVVGRIAAYLGTGAATLDEAAAQRVAAFQQARGLASDGKIGPRTWRVLKPEVGAPEPPAKAEAVQEPAKVAKAPEQVPKETKNDKGADAKAPPALVKGPATPPVTRTATSTPVKAGGPLSGKEIAKAMASYRSSPVDPEWMARFQAALGVPVSGVLTEATLQAFAQRQVDGGTKVPNVEFWTRKGRAVVTAMIPDLPVSEQAFKSEPGKLAKGQRVGESEPEDVAVRKFGYAGMADYVSKFQSIQLLGKTFVGHALFIERLQMAKAFLAGMFPDKSDAELGKLFGITSISHYRPSSLKSPQAYHGTGFALDLNPSNNPWILGDKAKSAENRKETAEIIARATRFMGFGEAIDVSKLSSLGKSGSTEEAFDRIEASSRALREYRAFAKDKAALAAHLEKGGVPADMKALGVEHWFAQIQKDHLAYAKRNWKKGNTEDGIMDLNKVVVQALRDAAGLAWGGTDLAGDSGDMMHFDGRHIGLAKDIRRERDKAAGK